MPVTEVPQYHELLLPRCSRYSSSEARLRSARSSKTVIKREGFSDEQQSVLHNDGLRPRSATGSCGAAPTSRAWVCRPTASGACEP